MFDISDRIQEGTRPTILDDALPPIFMDIFVQCWSTNPSERYEVAEIVNLLTTIQELSPSSSDPILKACNDSISHYASM